MGKLNNIDKAAEGKGSGINTLWQFVKFIVVSLGACIVQFGLVNILPLIFRPLYDSPCDFFVFHYPVEDGGWGYFWVFAISSCSADLHCVYRRIDLLLTMAEPHRLRLDSQ